ncbi:MAG: lasso peptide biosynthesis B2 protein [Phycisphaerae bacterium]
MIRTVLRAHVWAFCGVVPLLVRLMPLERLIRLLTPQLRPYRNVAENEIAGLIQHRLANPRNMKRRRCLRLGLALYHFLRLSGRAAIIHFAVCPGRADDRMHAHCWVTLGERCVSSFPAAGAAEMVRYPRTAPASVRAVRRCDVGGS